MPLSQSRAYFSRFPTHAVDMAICNFMLRVVIAILYKGGSASLINLSVFHFFTNLIYNHFMFMTTVEKEKENNVAINMIQLCVLGFHNCIFVHRDIFEVK